MLRVVSSQFLLDAGSLLARSRIRAQLSILNCSEAKVDLVMIQTLLLFKCKFVIMLTRYRSGTIFPRSTPKMLEYVAESLTIQYGLSPSHVSFQDADTSESFGGLQHKY